MSGATDLLLAILIARSRAGTQDALPMSVIANPNLATTLQQFLPMTDRKALVLSSGRTDATNARLVVQFQQQQLQVATNASGADQTVLLDTFQGVGTLLDHVGETGYTWGQALVPASYQAPYWPNSAIDARGLKPAYVNTTFGQNIPYYMPSITTDLDTFTFQVNWSLLAVADNKVKMYFDTTSGNGDYVDVSYDPPNGEISITTGNEGFQFVNLPIGWNTSGDHTMRLEYSPSSQKVYLDDVLYIEYANAYAGALAYPQVAPTIATGAPAGDYQTFRFTQFSQTVAGSQVISQENFNMGIEAPQLKPNKTLDFKVAPTNPVSIAADAATLPASALASLLNIVQGF